VQREMLNDAEVAQILGVSVWTLRTWRCKGCGPRFVRISNRCRYPARDLATYVRSLPGGGGVQAAQPEGGE
jgi:predicted site-specific integrase-resolvase